MRKTLITFAVILALTLYGLIVYSWIQEGNQNFDRQLNNSVDKR